MSWSPILFLFERSSVRWSVDVTDARSSQWWRLCRVVADGDTRRRKLPPHPRLHFLIVSDIREHVRMVAVSVIACSGPATPNTDDTTANQT